MGAPGSRSAWGVDEAVAQKGAAERELKLELKKRECIALQNVRSLYPAFAEARHCTEENQKIAGSAWQQKRSQALPGAPRRSQTLPTLPAPSAPSAPSAASAAGAPSAPT